jgi:hypothetical protein
MLLEIFQNGTVVEKQLVIVRGENGKGINGNDRCKKHVNTWNCRTKLKTIIDEKITSENS